MTTQNSTASTACPGDLARALRDAVQGVIDARIADLPYREGLAEYRAAQDAATRSLAVWIKDGRTVVVDVIGDRYRYMAAQVLDAASASFDLGPNARIVDLSTGAALIW
ncbi:hypothetical protein [Actinomadura opuntiae]|uniref:hypothetical protein n=1 Tax=Actinomadura sp. OS1-43 TaxID=604315 RepID=UPI00255B2C0A|nr:hypothetical protein [Actinomadura sp. OS1-43]MDL4812772.1 hypothetical protein [Actinomadura sp. OS1-43]